MDTSFLETFVAVAEAGSLAEAARRLDLAPTTVAQQIRALETDIGSQLLRRAGRTVQPTVAGNRILARARTLLREVRDLRSEASEHALPAGPLHLGATPTALMGMLTPALLRWRQVHEDIEIRIEPGTSAALLTKVLAGDIRAAQDLPLDPAAQRAADPAGARETARARPAGHRGTRALHPLRP